MGTKSKAKAASDATLIPQGSPADELTAYCPDLEQWPRSWMYEERDLSHGQQMVECFKPFLRHLVSSGPSRRTLRLHRDNLWILGGEIISKLHEDPQVLSLSQGAQHGRPISSQAMDMWTTQERCPHAHSLNNKYKSQTKIESAKD